MIAKVDGDVQVCYSFINGNRTGDRAGVRARARGRTQPVRDAPRTRARLTIRPDPAPRGVRAAGVEYGARRIRRPLPDRVPRGQDPLARYRLGPDPYDRATAG